MKTREQVDALKKNWLNDPCWDIYETEGFEEYRDELVTFQTNMHQEWRLKEYNRIYNFAKSLGIEHIEPNLELAKYLSRIGKQINDIEARLEHNALKG